MDSNQQHKWQTSSGLAFWGTTIQTIFCFLGLVIILCVLYNFIDIAMNGIMNSIFSMNSNYLTEEMENYGATAMLCFIFSFFGCIFYLIGVCLFKGAQVSPNSEMRTRNIMLTELIMPALLILVFAIVYNSPKMIKDEGDVIGLLLLMWLGSLAAVIFLLLQFKSLSKEETWSEKSRKGASDVKFSYACILWNQLVVIIGIAIILLTLYSFRSRIQSMRFDIYGMGDVYNGVNSLSDLVNTFKVSIQLEVVFISLLVFIFGTLQTIYRIAGWRKIQKGINASQSTTSKCNSESGSFCHKCGVPLPAGSAFCPGCGTPVAVVASSEIVEKLETESSGGDLDNHVSNLKVNIEENFENEGSENRKKWMLWGGIGAGVIVLGVLIWALCGRPKNIETYEEEDDTAEVYVIDEEEAECFDTAPYEGPYYEEETD